MCCSSTRHIYLPNKANGRDDKHSSLKCSCDWQWFGETLTICLFSLCVVRRVVFVLHHCCLVIHATITNDGCCSWLHMLCSPSHSPLFVVSVSCTSTIYVFALLFHFSSDCSLIWLDISHFRFSIFSLLCGFLH